MPKRETLTDEMCRKYKVRICWTRRSFAQRGPEQLQTEKYLGAASARSVAERVRIASLGNIDAWAEVMIGRNGAGAEIWQRVDVPVGGRHG